MICVMTTFLAPTSLLLIKNLAWSGWMTRVEATYNCPWAKHWSYRKIPTLPKIVWPCNLFIEKAKAGYTGNCRLFHSIPTLSTSDSNSILGKITRSLFLAEPTAYSKFPDTFSTISRVPLHMFLFWLMLRITMIGICCFKRSSNKGIPETLREFKYSTGTSGFSAEGVSEALGSLQLKINHTHWIYI